jgi:uncharacterized integral membrane protein
MYEVVRMFKFWILPAILVIMLLLVVGVLLDVEPTGASDGFARIR